MTQQESTLKKWSLLSLVWPIFVEQLLQMLMGSIDTLMLSQYSDKAVAAVGVAAQVYALATFLFGFVATGAGVLIVQAIGARRPTQVGEVSVAALSMNLLVSIMVSMTLVAFAEPFLRLFKLTEELISYGVPYLTIIGLSSMLSSLIVTVGVIMRGHGHVREVMTASFLMNILNAAGNYIVLFEPFGLPVLGVEGVAVVTVISRAIGVFILLILFQRRLPGLLPYRRILRCLKQYALPILRIGIPSAGEYISYNASQVVITSFVAILGTVALTTKIYTQNLTMFIFLFSVSIGQATQILVGRLIGGGQSEEAYRICLKSLKISLLITFGVSIGMFSFAQTLLGLFTDDPLILETGRTLMLLSLILEAGRTFNIVLIGSLNAGGDVRFPVIVGIISMWGLSVPLSYFFGISLGFGLAGIWWAFIIDEWLRGLLMLWRWRSRSWQRIGLSLPEASNL
ncbi:MATE family efflux transporter [Brevibacillus reuszeri]|uniref:MATE family efflux transporter n=1 Tax=Brevibacillus reuszeri TaxID=54915 RepID=UPI00289F5BCE|nr:MATE family efflux transporter [Brevibacillus reuszeri]